MEKTIYLAGSATRDREFAIKWRVEATTKLENYGFRTLSPFRDRDLNNVPEETTSAEIVTRDLDDIRRSSLVLAEMVFDDYNYIGTSMEIMAANMLNIPVVVWTDKWKEHYWVKHHAVRCLPTLDEACKYICKYWR